MGSLWCSISTHEYEPPSAGVELAKLAREHNDANVLSLPARFISREEAEAIVSAFLDTAFEGGRHAARVEKIPIH